MDFWHNLSFLRRAGILFTVGIVFLLFINLNISSSFREPIVVAWSFLFTGVHGVTLRVHEYQTALFQLGNVMRDNAILREENNELIAENTKLKEVALENEYLREQLELQEKKGFSIIPASIVAKHPTNFIRMFIIDKGSEDGVRIGRAVITSERSRKVFNDSEDDVVPFLVGRISHVEKHYARVTVITDKDSVVPAKIQTSRTDGLVRGKGLGYGLIMEYIQQDEFFKINDVVVTSGLASLHTKDVEESLQGDEKARDSIMKSLEDRFPSGIYIGVVYDRETSPSDVSQRAHVRPLINFGELEYVAVLR